MIPKHIFKIPSIFTIVSIMFMVGNGYCVSIRLGWNPLERGEVTGYRLYYGMISGLYDKVIDARKGTVKAIRLKKGYEYYVVVTAYNEYGESEPSNEVQVNTCTYRLAPGKKKMKQIGGTGTVKVVTQPDCAWTSVSGVTWLTITAGSEGLGKGLITYSVEPNDTYELREADSRFAGKIFALSQKGKKQP
jgi:hypothetical protein